MVPSLSMTDNNIEKLHECVSNKGVGGPKNFVDVMYGWSLGPKSKSRERWEGRLQSRTFNCCHEQFGMRGERKGERERESGSSFSTSVPELHQRYFLFFPPPTPCVEHEDNVLGDLQRIKKVP